MPTLHQMKLVRWVDFTVRPNCRITAKSALLYAMACACADVEHEMFLDTLYCRSFGTSFRYIGEGVDYALSIAHDSKSGNTRCRFIVGVHTSRKKPPKKYFEKFKL